MKEIITERPNLFEPNVYITMCAEVTGKICLHQLTAAVKEAYKANEAAMSRIVLEHGIAYYEKLSVSGCKTMITHKNWIELVKENEKLPFQIDKGELVRTFIIPAGAHTQIMIMAHHLAGDGKSIIYLIKDIMNALAANPLTYKPLVMLERNSVNSYLVTLFLQKYQKKCEVGIPVSIRDSKNEAMSNLTSGISINHLFNTKKTFAKNAIQVHAKIKRKLRNKRVFILQFLAELPTTLIDAVLLNTHNCYSDRLAEHTAKIMGYTGKTRDLGITNLTEIDIPVLYGSYKIENIIFVPPAVSYSHNIIGISTVNGKMTFSFHNMVRLKTCR